METRRLSRDMSNTPSLNFLKKYKVVETNTTIECKQAMYTSFTMIVKGETNATQSCQDEVVIMSDLAPLIKALKDILSSKKSDKRYLALLNTPRKLVIDSRESLIYSDQNLIKDIRPANGSVVVMEII